MPADKTLIHYCALHCHQGNSDKLYTLLVYRVEKDESDRTDPYLFNFEVWAAWGRRGQEQKEGYKFSGRYVAGAFDAKVREQRDKGYEIVDGGPVGSNTDYWCAGPALPMPISLQGKLPTGSPLGQPEPMHGVGFGNTGSGAAPNHRAPGQDRPRPMPDYEPDDGPIARAFAASRGAKSLAEALSTPIRHPGTAEDQQRRQDFADLDAAAEVDKLRARLAELEAAQQAGNGNAAGGVTRRIILEE